MPGTGAYVQAANLLVLVGVIVLFGRVTMGLAERLGALLIAACTVSICFRVLQYGVIELAEAQQLGKILLSLVALMLARGYVHQHGASLAEIRWAFALGMVATVLSQVFGVALGVAPEDASYTSGLVGLSSSVSLFSAYLASVTPLLGALIRPGILRTLVYLVGSLQVIATLRRTAWASLILQSIWQVTQGKHAFRRVLAIAIVIVTGMVLLPAAMPDLASSAQVRASTLFNDQAIGSGRSVFYAIAADEILACRVTACAFGIGRAELLVVMGTRFGSEIGAHSVLLDTGLMFGWPALVLLIFFLLALGTRVWKARGAPRLLAGMAFVNLLTFALLSGVAFDAVMLPSFIAIGMSARAIPRSGT